MIAEEIPKRQTKKSCGYDIVANKDIVITPNVWQVVNTGVRFDGNERMLSCDRDEKWFAMIVPRSSYGFKYKLRFSNTVAIIDQDYRQDIMLQMTADEEVYIKKGERYAQMVILPYLTFWDEEVPTSERIGGLGSTTRQMRLE